MNSELYNNEYNIPSKILDYIRSKLVVFPEGNGVKRAKFILNNRKLTYQALKRLKNFFDNYNGNDEQQFELAGGNLMKTFIDSTLNRERTATHRSKEAKRPITNDIMSDFIMENDDGITDKCKKNAIAIIINNDKKILLLKRADVPEMWGAGKWALVGGGIEEGEEPVEACQREISEETGLKLSVFSHKYIIQREPDNIEYIFITKYDGNDDDIILDESENTEYGWFIPEEIRLLKHVPNLIDYINLAFKEY